MVIRVKVCSFVEELGWCLCFRLISRLIFRVVVKVLSGMVRLGIMKFMWFFYLLCFLVKLGYVMLFCNCFCCW